MAVGETATLPAPRSAVVRIGSKKILGAVDEGTRIRLMALKPGETTAAINGHVRKVIVTGAGQKKFLSQLNELLKDRMGLRGQITNGQIEITGQLLRWEDWRDIAQLSQRTNGAYNFRAVPLPDVAETAIRRLHQMARKEKWPPFRLTSKPHVTAQLPAGTKAALPTVKQALAAYGITVEMDNSAVEIHPLIRTRVILAELSKDISQDIGIEWPAGYQAQVVPKWQNPSSILVELRAMESRGLGKVLAAPNLTCRSGSEAAFHAGGEFPIRVISRMTKDVVWKKHGVILKVKPTADYNGNISLNVETEISLLDVAHAVDGIPALKTNRVQSHFDLVGGKTIALSGLIRQDWGNSREGLAGLSQIPILGWLFGSEKFLNHQSELVVFVTPELISPEADEEIKMPEGWADDAQ